MRNDTRRTSTSVGTGSAGSTGGSAGGTGSTGSAGQRAEQKAVQATERVAQKAQAAVDNTREKLAQQLDGVARAIESAANSLQQSQHSGLGRKIMPYVRKVEDASQRLRDKSPRELKDDVDRVARDKPAWFLGGAFLLGLLGARFLKSSEKASLQKEPVQYARA